MHLVQPFEYEADSTTAAAKEELEFNEARVYPSPA
jgi:hypothetical protein